MSSGSPINMAGFGHVTADCFFDRESIKVQKTSHVEGHQISSSLLIREDFVAAARGVDSIYLTQVFVLTVLHLCSTGISCCW